MHRIKIANFEVQIFLNHLVGIGNRSKGDRAKALSHLIATNDLNVFFSCNGTSNSIVL